MKLDSKSYIDKRGFVAYPFTDILKNTEIFDIHIGTIEPGSIRGNHYHKNSTEWIFLYNSDGIFYKEANNSIQEEAFSKSETKVFEIEPECAHAIVNKGFSTMHFTSFTVKSDSTVRKVIVKDVYNEINNIKVDIMQNDLTPTGFLVDDNYFHITDIIQRIDELDCIYYNVNTKKGDFNIVYNVRKCFWKVIMKRTYEQL